MTAVLGVLHVTWPKSPTAALAPHCLSEFGACTACGQPVHTVGPNDGAVHTATGLFRCSEYPFGQASLNQALDRIESAIGDAVDDAKSEMRHDIRRVITQLRTAAETVCACSQAFIADALKTIEDSIDD